MRKERITCTLSQDEIEKNVLIIKPFHLKDFDDDSIYDFKLPSIYATDGTVLNPRKITFITKPSASYASIADVRNMLGDIDISDERILRQIKEASRYVEVLIAKAHEQRNTEYSKEDLIALRGNYSKMKEKYWYVWEFVVLKATYECLSNLYAYMATKPEKVKEMLSDLSKEFSYNLAAIKALLNDFKKRYEEIAEQFVSFADMTFVVRGRTCIPYNVNYNIPYHRLNGMNSYVRNFNNGRGWR